MSKEGVTFCLLPVWNPFSAQAVYLLLWSTERSRPRTRRRNVDAQLFLLLGISTLRFA